jgi:fido (protein-threonine AMPylation protein)
LPPKNRRSGSRPRRPPPPFPWDAHNPGVMARIAGNLLSLRAEVVARGRAGELPTVDDVRSWHLASLHKVRLAEPWVAGGFRGEGPPRSKLATYPVAVNNVQGEHAARVRRTVAKFFDELPSRVVAVDDELTAAGAATAADADDLLYDRALEVIAWTHGEWIRIHPFADNNGCTARLLSIFVSAHFGLPLPFPGKPRSDAPVATNSAGLELTYDRAAAAQMVGNDQAMVEYLHEVANP